MSCKNRFQLGMSNVMLSCVGVPSMKLLVQVLVINETSQNPWPCVLK